MMQNEQTILFVSGSLFVYHFCFLVANSVVYDCVEMSPMYDNTVNDLYIDEHELIELPPPSQSGEGTINEPYQKRYYFNPNNLPYSLEQAHNYSAY